MNIVVQHQIPIPVAALDLKASYFLSQVRKLVREAKQEQPGLAGYALEDIGFTPLEDSILVNLYFYPDSGPKVINISEETEAVKT